jgi:hypothetical protein
MGDLKEKLRNQHQIGDINEGFHYAPCFTEVAKLEPSRIKEMGLQKICNKLFFFWRKGVNYFS